jgi:uncharacterized membrane protein
MTSFPAPIDKGDDQPGPANAAPRSMDPADKMAVVMAASYFEGPIPPPDILRQFEEIIPGSAARIFDVAMQQSTSRIANQNKIVDANILDRRLGMAFGFIMSCIGITGGCVVAALGYGSYGATIVGLMTAGLATCYLSALSQQSKDLESKRELMDKVKGGQPPASRVDRPPASPR